MPIVKLDKDKVFSEVDGNFLASQIAGDIIFKYIMPRNKSSLKNFTKEIMIGGELHSFLIYSKIEPILIFESENYPFICDIKSIVESLVMILQRAWSFNHENKEGFDTRKSTYISLDANGNEVELEDTLYNLGKSEYFVKLF